MTTPTWLTEPSAVTRTATIETHEQAGHITVTITKYHTVVVGLGEAVTVTVTITKAETLILVKTVMVPETLTTTVTQR